MTPEVGGPRVPEAEDLGLEDARGALRFIIGKVPGARAVLQQYLQQHALCRQLSDLKAGAALCAQKIYDAQVGGMPV